MKIFKAKMLRKLIKN